MKLASAALFLLLSLASAASSPANDNDKRYVEIGAETSFKKRHVQMGGLSTDIPSHDWGPSLLKNKSSIFSHAPASLKLARAAGQSAELVRRGLLHPLLYHTQHLNRALSRRTSIGHGGDKQKRNLLLRNHAREAEQRMRARWISLHQERGLEAPELQLSKRGCLEPVSQDLRRRGINLYGLRGDMAQSVSQSLRESDGSAAVKSTDRVAATTNSTRTNNAAAASAGFSETKLAAASSGGTTKFDGTLGVDHAQGLTIEANDVGYFGALQLGTPGTQFNVLFDTGSADFWVPSQQCNSDGDCGGHKTLGTASSSSFAATKKAFQVTYGTGAVQGVMAQDTVALPDGTLSLPNHTFGVNTDETQDFAASDVPFDGLMGMALSSLSNQAVPTYIESLQTNGLVKNAQMGYKLASVDDAIQDSEVTFGGVDTTKLGSGGLVEFANVDKNGFWTGALQSVSVDGQAVSIAAKTAILDTGTSLIVAPEADAIAFHAAIPGSSQSGSSFTIPCTTSSRLEFEFGGTKFQMNPADLAFVPVDANDLTGDCVSAVSAGDIDDIGSWLLGDAFLKSVYYATDVASNTIGLSQLFAGSTATASSSTTTASSTTKKKKKTATQSSKRLVKVPHHERRGHGGHA